MVLRDTFLSKVRTSKQLQADIVEIDRMREDDSRRTLKWLAEIHRPTISSGLEWARKLQMKSITSGAIDADSAPGQSDRGKGGGKGKGKGKGKGRGRGKRDSSRDSSNPPTVKGICHMYVRHARCENDN